MPYELPHHRLRVYHKAKQLAVTCHQLSKQVPRGYGHILDDLRRSSSAVPLLVGEGANIRPSRRKKQRYAEALGECGETAVALELLHDLGVVDATNAIALCIETHRMLQPLSNR